MRLKQDSDVDDLNKRSGIYWTGTIKEQRVYYECENPDCSFELYEGELVCALCGEPQYKLIPPGPYSQDAKIRIYRANEARNRRVKNNLSLVVLLIIIFFIFVLPFIIARRIPRRTDFMGNTRRYASSDSTKFIGIFFTPLGLYLALCGGLYSENAVKRIKRHRYPFGLLRYFSTNKYVNYVLLLIPLAMTSIIGAYIVEPKLMELMQDISARASNVGFIYNLGAPLYYFTITVLFMCYFLSAVFNIYFYDIELEIRKEDHVKRLRLR